MEENKAKIVDINSLDGDELTYRMYCFVLRQLSPIQKGIQSAHAIVDYAKHYAGSDEYYEWSNFDETIIILDGGVVSDLENIMSDLCGESIRYGVFQEPDLNNIITAVAVLVDERVFDRESYPDFDDWRNAKYPVREMHLVGGNTWMGDHDSNDFTWTQHHDEWLNTVIGGEKNEFLRKLISNKRLAN